MLTVNADAHPFYKRMVVILDREEYLPWLTCPTQDAPRFFKAWPGPLVGEPAPLARAPKVVADPPPRDEILPPKPAKPVPPPPPPPAQGSLF